MDDEDTDEADDVSAGREEKDSSETDDSGVDADSDVGVGEREDVTEVDDILFDQSDNGRLIIPDKKKTTYHYSNSSIFLSIL